ncbi:jg5007, partial [Pararge aegeria aegeria]
SLPPHIGIGAPEDTLGSCFGLIPKPPHKDIIKYNLNANKVLEQPCTIGRPPKRFTENIELLGTAGNKRPMTVDFETPSKVPRNLTLDWFIG